ncbi:MAG: hypothetical protein LCH54_07325 [Bacteroidetes bacterium]|nr:hypothetical protein [Bacteroidota bacterium]
MIQFALLALSFSFQSVQPDSSEHSHVTTSKRVTPAQSAIFYHDFSDSSRYYRDFYDLTDAQNLAEPGIKYSLYGTGQRSSFFYHGLRPSDQSFLLNGMEVTDLVTGGLYPSFLMISTLAGMKPVSSLVGQAPISWEVSGPLKTYSVPVTTISYQQGFDNLQQFEGVFTAKLTENWSGQFGVGRKTFDGPFEGTSGTSGVLPGSADQYQVTARFHQQIGTRNSIDYFFSSDRLSSGNPGGMDDSLLATGESSRSNPITTRFISPAATSKHRLFVSQIAWNFSDTLYGLIVTNRLLSGYQTGFSKTKRPADDLNNQVSTTSSRYDINQITNQLGFNLSAVSLRFIAGIRQEQIQGSNYLPDYTRYRHIPVGGEAEWDWMGASLRAGYRHEFNNRQADGKKLFGTGEIPLFGFIFSGRYSMTERPVSWLDAYLKGKGQNYDLTDYIRETEIKITQVSDKFVWSAGLAATHTELSGAGVTTGRVVPDSIASIGAAPDLSSTSLFVSFIHSWNVLETEGTYLFTDSGVLPNHKVQLGFFYTDLFFTDHLYLKAGVEGTYQSSGIGVYLDNRYNSVFYDPNTKSGNTKKVDLLIRAKVSDIIFHLTWENVTNEPYELYQGYPMPISRVHFGLIWWIWN